ncbi:putative transmembrane protein [Sesbania bispinosa]|nr:putative transmembrane protein [Sesbania bispinosa]
MSGSNPSDSQNPSKSESLMSESSGSTTESDSIFDSSATETSVTSRPPSNVVSHGRAEIPVVNLSDEDSPIQNVDDNPAEEETDLDVGSDGTPHFPLFWSLEPHRVPKVDLNTLSEEDKAVVEWLREQDLIDCSALLENEDNLVGLQTLLGNMPPKSQTTKTMDEVAMLKALRARERKAKAAEKNNASSVDCLGTGQVQGDGGNPTSQRKKQKVDDGGNPGGANLKPPSSGSTQNATRAQMAFFGLCVDQYVGNAEKELKNLLLKNKELTEKLKNAEGDIKIVERLKTDLQDSEKKNTDLLTEKGTWDEKFSNIEKKNEDLKKKNDDLLAENKNLGNKVSTLTSEKKELINGKELVDAEIGDLKAQIAMHHTFGFEKAVGQVKFLYPDLKVDEVGAFKHVVDGKLVDIIVDEDEE